MHWGYVSIMILFGLPLRGCRWVIISYTNHVLASLSSMLKVVVWVSRYAVWRLRWLSKGVQPTTNLLLALWIEVLVRWLAEVKTLVAFLVVQHFLLVLRQLLEKGVIPSKVLLLCIDSGGLASESHEPTRVRLPKTESVDALERQ